MNQESLESLDLKTGDIILFSGNQSGLYSILPWLVRIFTHSNYSHIGMILKDPTFISPELKGYYVWESSWEASADPQDNKKKIGVQITPIEEIYKSFKDSVITIRKPTSYDSFTDDTLKKIHKEVYGKPYDMVPIDWLEAFFRKDIHPQKTDRFWCSALVGYIYTVCGILKSSTDWSILRPSDFSVMAENLEYSGDCKLTNQEIRIQ
jgi:hypothetical protein